MKLLYEGHLRLLHAEGNTVVPILNRALRSTDPRTRSSAAIDLGRYGRSASQAVAALLETLRDKDEWWFVRESAAKAMGMIGLTQEQTLVALPVLRDASRDSNPGVRTAAEAVLQGLLSRAQEGVRF
ncbi:MAG: HEAT repeat domain-containing protein [Verrucomicrobia bacterium]|nr:HEAT repeat domain-containing protein [Verrucomicrobiota bacterium]